MAWRRYLPAGFTGIAGALAALAAALLVAARPSASAPRARRAADPAELVAYAPPRRADPESARAAIEDAGRSLAGAPRVVLEERHVEEEGLAARFALEPDAKKTIVGDWDSPGARRIDVASRPAPPRPVLRSLRFRERVPSGRAVAISCEGEGLTAARLSLALDGRPAQPVAARERADGSLEVSLAPLAPGPHELAASGGPEEAPIRARFEAQAPPIVLVAGSPSGLLASALRTQGFETRPLAGADPKDCAAILVTDPSAPFASIADAVRDGAGCLVAGPRAVEAAARSPLAPLLPARPRPAEPAPESQPSGPPDPGAPNPHETPPPPADPAPKTPSEPKAETPPGPSAGPPKVEKKTEEAPVVALAILIDRSGSMALGAKMDLAKQAALASARVLAPDDFIAILSFDASPHVEYQLSRAGALDLIQRRLEGIYPGGGTRYYNAIVEATNQLERAQLAARHVILVTDGVAEDMVTDRQRSQFRDLLTGRLAPQGITLSTVFIEGEGDQDPIGLKLLAHWGGGQAFSARSGEDVPALVLAEVRRKFGIPEGAQRRLAPGGREGPAANANSRPASRPERPPDPPKPKNTPPKPEPARRRATVTGEPGSAILEGIDLAGLPPVDAFVSMDPNEGAAVLLRRAEDGSALLAARAAGLGSLAMLSIDERGGLDRWESDPRLLQLLGRLASAIARAEAAPPDSRPFRALALDGTLWWEGEDPFGILPPWVSTGSVAVGAVHRREVGDAASGEVGRTADGRIETSARVAASEPAADTSVEAAIARLREGGARPASAAGSPSPSTPPQGPSRAATVLLGAALVCALGAAFAARRSD